MANTIQRVTYLSEINQDTFDSDALSSLLKCSRDNNQAKNITGMLVCDYSHFLQVLEGDIDTIATLYDLIKQDNRHHSVKLLESVEVESRLFAQWAMGFSKVLEAPSGTLVNLDLKGATEMLLRCAKRQYEP